MRYRKVIVFKAIEIMGKFHIGLAITVIKMWPKHLSIMLLLGTKLEGTFKLQVSSKELKLQLGSNDDHFIAAATDTFSEWEPQSLEVWENVVSKNSIVLDVGAYLGIYSLLAEKAGAAKVYAFEPNPRSATKLKKNLTLNQSERIYVIPAACGAEKGTIFIETPINRELSSGARVIRSEYVDSHSGWKKQFQVEQIVIDDFISAEEINRISAIKVDAEGYEIEVLKGCANILLIGKPYLILEILSEEQFNLICEYLAQKQYTEFAILDSGTQIIFTKLGDQSKIPKLGRNFLFRSSIN